MLYPDFNQLLNLQHQAKKLGLRLRDQISSAVSGDYSSKIYGSGLEFEGVREYVFGDDIRDIDWRVTARTGKTHSKIFTVENEQNVSIIVDMNSNMYFGTKSTFKSTQSAKAAGLIGWFFNQGGNRVGGMIFGNSSKEKSNDSNVTIFQPSKTKKSLLKLLRNLSENKISNQYIPLYRVLANLNKIVSAGSRIYIISDFSNFNSDIIGKDLARFMCKGCYITFVQIIDQRDYDIPPMGLISFMNNAGQTMIIDTNNNVGRQKYQEIWNNNQQKLKDLVNKMNIKLITIHTDDDIYMKFRNLYQNPSLHSQ